MPGGAMGEWSQMRYAASAAGLMYVKPRLAPDDMLRMFKEANM